MNRTLWAFVALAGVLAALFVRFGFWQLERLGQRRAENALLAARIADPTRPFLDVRTQSAPWDRRATIEGVPDYENEFVVTGRSRNGSPGVHILTPVRVAGYDSAVLVNRGWVYAPDAATVDLARWRERRTMFSGITQQITRGDTRAFVKGRSLRPLVHNGVSRLVPYPFDELYLVSQDSGGDSIPARLPAPQPDNGPHLSYAIQWFCFAAIALGGAAIVVVRARRAQASGSTGARAWSK